MRAVIRAGLLGSITFTKDHPLPAAKESDSALSPTDILIKVRNAAINPVDYKLPRLFGKVVGIDVSGVVEKVGSDVTDFQVGDEVFGRAINNKGMFQTFGSLADYAVTDMQEVAKKPEWLPFDQAAALGVAYLTGIQSMRAGNVKDGSSVLIIGASGGCGIAGVQLARAMGARVVGVCSGKNFDFVREMSGCEKAEDLELVDYTDDDAMNEFKEKNVKMFDCIYDTATGSGKGEDYTTSMPKLLKDTTGQYVQINGSPSTWARHAMGKMKPQRKMLLTAPKGRSELEEIVSLLEKSGVKPHLNVKSFDEQGVAEAFEELKGRRTKGKIVFDMN